MKSKVFAWGFCDFFRDVRNGIIGFQGQTELQQQKPASRRLAFRLHEERLFRKSGQTVAEARKYRGQGTSTTIILKKQ